MGYFPFFVDINDKPGLIIGGGMVALRKAEKLLPYGPKLSVAAPELCPELTALPGLRLLRRSFAEELLDGQSFVIAATNDRELNHRVSGLCTSRGLPVNVVDDREACSFLFPSLIKRGELSVGVSTGGASPSAAIWLREAINGLLPDNFESILEQLNSLRPKIKQNVSEERQRAKVFNSLFALCMESGRPMTAQELGNFLEVWENE